MAGVEVPDEDVPEGAVCDTLDPLDVVLDAVVVEGDEVGVGVDVGVVVLTTAGFTTATLAGAVTAREAME